MKRNRSLVLAIILLSGLCILSQTAHADRWGGRHHPRHHHSHHGAFWPGFAFGLGTAVLGSSIYYHYYSPRVVYVDPPVTTVIPCPGYPPCPPPCACPPDDCRYGCPESPEPAGAPSSVQAPPSTETQTAEAMPTDRGHFYTQTYWQEGHYEANGQWVEGRYVQIQKQWVNGTKEMK